MKCPFCGNLDSKVLDSRTVDEGLTIRRRRVCEKCSERFTTHERVDSIPLVVIKRDGARENFDRDKLINGLIKSCNKRPISVKKIERIATDIENSVFSSLNKEVYSNEIGEMVMDMLRDIDEVAYVRFASVYRQFKDIDTFIDELSKILQEKKSK